MSDMDELLRLFEHGEELGPEAPLVYLAMPLSQLREDEAREHVALLTDAVARAIEDVTQTADDRWHGPGAFTAQMVGPLGA